MIQRNGMRRQIIEDASGGVPAAGPYSTSSREDPAKDFPLDRPDTTEEVGTAEDLPEADEEDESTLGAEENKKLNEYPDDVETE